MDKLGISDLLTIIATLQGLHLFILGWIKLDNMLMRKQLNSHGHKVVCKPYKGVCQVSTAGVIPIEERGEDN